MGCSCCVQHCAMSCHDVLVIAALYTSHGAVNRHCAVQCNSIVVSSGSVDCSHDMAALCSAVLCSAAQCLAVLCVAALCMAVMCMAVLCVPVTHLTVMLLAAVHSAMPCSAAACLAAGAIWRCLQGAADLQPHEAAVHHSYVQFRSYGFQKQAGPRPGSNLRPWRTKTERTARVGLVLETAL